MALVQFKDEINKIEITKKMFPPKKVEHHVHWFDAARKVIPQIPSILGDGYGILLTQCNETWITWELTSPKGERCYVTINRKVPSIG